MKTPGAGEIGSSFARVSLLFFFILGLLIKLPADVYSQGLTPEHSRICFQKHCFVTQIARSSKERQDGLMNRDSLAADQAMIFVFENPGIYRIWMKNMQFRLDVLWLHSDGTILDCLENLPPCLNSFCPTYQPKREAAYVLELPAGTVKRLDMKPGDRFNLPQEVSSKPN